MPRATPFHPAESVLLDYAAGGGSEQLRSEIATHLSRCAQCTDYVRGLDDTSPGGRPPTDQLAGAKIGEYVILERLGQGGMGVVYRGEQPLIGKQVAVKVLQQSIANDAVLVHRMLEEARAVNAVRHPNIVDIFAFGKLPDGRPYMVMELLEGQSLSETLVDRGQLTVEEAVTILAEAMAALEAAHAVGVVHRDLKPENIHVDARTQPWKVKLLDFGLAKRQGTGQQLTQPGAVMGTPGYMAPEQVRGADQVTAKTDIYAMGVVAWTMLAGQEPFGGGSSVEVMHRQLTMAPPPLAPKAQGLPPVLESLVMRMLEKEPDRRPTAADVRYALTELQKSLHVPTPPTPPAEAPGPPLGAIAAVVLAVLLAGGGAVYLFAGEEAPPPNPLEPTPLSTQLVPQKKKDDPPKLPAKPADVVVTPPSVAEPVKERSTAKVWRCKRIIEVTEVLGVMNAEWAFFVVRIDGEPNVMVTTTRSNTRTLKALRKKVAGCQGSDLLLHAKRTRDDHPGLFDEKLHRHSGFEAVMGDVTVAKAGTSN